MSEIDDLKAELRRLRDIQEIQELRHRYSYDANIINGKPGDLKRFAAMFADDGVFDPGMGAATGPAEIEALMKTLTTSWHCAMHYMVNQVIELDGDRATGKVTGLFAFLEKADSTPIFMSNIYSDKYVRTPSGWKFQHLTLELTFADPAFFKRYQDA